MTGRAGRLLLVLLVGAATGWWLDGLPFGAARRADASLDGGTVPARCREADPTWSEIGVDLGGAHEPITPGRVFRLSDGTIAVLVVVTAATADGNATAFDFAASVRVAAVIVRAGDDTLFTPFDPPARNGTGLIGPENRPIDHVAFCYRVLVPGPPPPGATAGPAVTPTVETPAATATPTTESFELGAVQTASALATEEAAARATADALTTAVAETEATRQAEAAAAEATIAALATARADQDATAAAQATVVAATATTDTEQRAAAQATAAAEIAAAQATAATLATADAARQTELATAQAVQTEAAATIAALQATAAAPTATPAAALLYGVPETEAFSAWALPSGWEISPEGLLVADGSKWQGYAQPSQPVDRDDYAVEAAIRVVEPPACASNFGIVVRGSESGFYAGGVDWICDAGSSARLWARDRLLDEANFPLDDAWHTYRIEVRGDRITFSVDGLVLAATDATYPAGGQVALWSNRVKLEVRAFRVFDVV
jgi:hypothetical protein